MVPTPIGRRIRPAVPSGVVTGRERSRRYQANQARHSSRSQPHGPPLCGGRRRRAQIIPATLIFPLGQDELPQVKQGDGGR